MTDRVLTWKGQPVDKLTREEALEALRWAIGEIERERALHDLTLSLLRGRVVKNVRPLLRDPSPMRGFSP